MKIHTIPRISSIPYEVMRDLPNRSDFFRHQAKIMFTPDNPREPWRPNQSLEIHEFKEAAAQFLTNVQGLWSMVFLSTSSDTIDASQVEKDFKDQWYGHNHRQGSSHCGILIFLFERSEDREKFNSEFLVMRKLST